jgi:hypothetical protein
MFRTEQERREANRPYYAAVMATVWIAIGLFTALALRRVVLGAAQALFGATVAADEVLRQRGTAKRTRMAARVLLGGACVALLLWHTLRR